MKQIVKINERELNNLIRESVRRVINEGMTTDNPAYEQWEYLKETLGAEHMLDLIEQYLDANMLEQIVEWFREDGYIDDEEDMY